MLMENGSNQALFTQRMYHRNRRQYMRILDEIRNESVNKITIMLNQSEALEFRDSLDSIIGKDKGHHAHVPSNDFKKEITIAIYDENNVKCFNDRIQRLIVDDA